jgi:hypothetical protein
VKLTAGGKTQTANLTVKMDPRVAASSEALARQFEAASGISDALAQDFQALTAVQRMRRKIAAALPGATGAPKESLSALDAKLADLQGSGSGRRGGRGGPAESLARLNGRLAELYAIVEAADAAPTTQAEAAWKDLQASLTKALANWEAIRRDSGKGLLSDLIKE